MLSTEESEDIVVWYKKRSEITTQDIYRVSACRIVDEQGNILLSQRSMTKKHDPGKWGPAVAGTVSEGEGYLETIVREIPEEIGIEVSAEQLIRWPKKLTTGLWTYFGQWFFLVYTWSKDLLRPEVWAVEQLARYAPESLKSVLSIMPDLYLPSVHRGVNYPWAERANG